MSCHGDIAAFVSAAWKFTRYDLVSTSPEGEDRKVEKSLGDDDEEGARAPKEEPERSELERGARLDTARGRPAKAAEVLQRSGKGAG